ncbi:DUF4190 domain-containing protein [Haloferula sp.]|uniref:DUF4190 domain-containing protein n=1 Tax=Haloferula sp. TaxID=2497595 RepID=UPI00329B248A
MNLNPPGYQGPNQQPIPGQPPGMGPGVTLGAKTSPMALWSMILGLASIPLIFLCVGIVTGILAIIFGCIGISAVSRGQGRVKGKSMAWTGIIAGVASYIIYGIFIANSVKNAAATPQTQRDAQSALSAVHTKVMSNRNGTAHGNTPEAKQIASEFSSSIKTMHSAFFEREGDEPAIRLSGGEFVTFCQLSEKGCAFIVHVPEYRKHTGDAKESLAELGWAVANVVAAGNPEYIPADSPVIVGLRGTVLYGAILRGRAGAEEPIAQLEDDEALLPFFTQPEEESPSEDEALEAAEE